MGRRNVSAQSTAPVVVPGPDDVHRTGATAPDGMAEEELIAFLNSAPPQLQSWARGEIAALRGTGTGAAGSGDRVIDLRSGSGADDEDPADEVGLATDEDLTDDEDPGEDVDPDLDVEELLGEQPDDDEDTGRVSRQRPAPRTGAGRGALGSLLRSRTGAVLAGLVVVVAVIAGVYLLGQRSTVPGIDGKTTDTSAAGATTAPLDQAKVAALMTKISANPKDIASLSGLGDLYFQAGDYKTAALWEQKVLAVDATNTTALLALGAAEFNTGDLTNAEKHWLQVVALNPRQAEAHYDLGFLYLSKTPADMTKVKAEWTKVVQIDPNSQIAKTVSTHLQSIGKTGTGATASPGASAPSGAGAATPSATSGK